MQYQRLIQLFLTLFLSIIAQAVMATDPFAETVTEVEVKTSSLEVSVSPPPSDENSTTAKTDTVIEKNVANQTIVETIPQPPVQAEPQISQQELNQRLFAVSAQGDTQTLAQLIEQGANVNFSNNSHETPLHSAASTGQMQTALILLQKGANTSASTSNGWTPLHHAARFGHAQLANHLATVSATLNARNQDGKTPTMLAEQLGHLRVQRILQAKGGI